MKRISSVFLTMALGCLVTGCVNIDITVPEEATQALENLVSELPELSDELSDELSGLAELTEQALEGIDTEELTEVLEQMEEQLPTEQTSEEQTPEEQITEEQTPEELENLYNQWDQLVGYWNTGIDQYVIFDRMDSHTACFMHNTWPSRDEYYGTVTSIRSDKEYELTAVVEYPDGSRPKETVVIDYLWLDQDGKIQIKIDDGEMTIYNFAGSTSDEAFIAYYENRYLTGDSGAGDPLWPDNEYTRQLSKPDLEIVAIDEKEEGFYVEFEKNITMKDVKAYVEIIQNSGFHINVEEDARAAGNIPRYSFYAENKEGYHVSVSWLSTGSSMSIYK